MSRVIFEDERPGLDFDTGRADIVCFVGLARVADAEIPPAVLEWLSARGWAEGRYARDLDQIADVPIPVESYAGFTAMFDPGGSSASSGTDYLAASVRSFFAQGGKRCYIVRMGDPVAPTDSKSTNRAKLDSLLLSVSHDPADPGTWHGIGHLAGLFDVSFLSLPDLAVLTASEPSGAIGQEPNPPSGPEQFVECTRADLTPPQRRVYSLPAPRLSSEDYFLWASRVADIVQHLLSRGQGQEPHLREIQFVTSFPLPQDLDAAAAGENPSIADLAQDIHEVIRTYFPEPLTPGASQFAPNISSAFLQVAYPWIRTSGSNVLLESLEPPEGALAGILARNALTRGTFTSATKITPSEIVDVWPQLPGEETKSSSTPLKWSDGSKKPLVERLSLFGFTPSGLRLLSDVTVYPGEAYRAARVNRLVSVICRAARRLGEEVVFDSNGPAVWARVEIFLQQLMTRLWTLGALDGTTVRDAFSVRCDRSTMTQNDLDNGRLVAQVAFTAAATVEVIRVTLALQAGSTSPQEVAVTLGEAA